MLKLAVTLSARLTDRGPRDFLMHTYVRYLSALDILPVLIPNNVPDLPGYLAALDVCGVVLTGGGDLDPARYGHANTHSVAIMPERDDTEFRLLDWALAQPCPVLGICRGVQVINAYLGGTLVQDIPALLNGTVDHDDVVHPVQIVDQAFAAIIGAAEIVTNSHHHQALTAANLAPDLVPFALSAPDGVIEGVYHREQALIGVQWHPEQTTPSRETDLALFRHFLANGAFWKD